MSQTLLDRGKRQAWTKLRARVLARDGQRCVLCGGTDRVQVDHIVERIDGGTDDLGNLQTLCLPHHQAKSAARRRARKKPTTQRERGRQGPTDATDPTSMQRAQDPRPDRLFVSHTTPEGPQIGTPHTDSPRTQSRSDPDPLRFPGPHPDAVGSHGDHAAAWIEQRLQADRATAAKLGGTRLRWWQWLVLQRLLEYRADGSGWSWCWPVGFVSVGRQLGKTELLCELAAWRCGNPDLFGSGQQLVGHTANTVTLSKHVQATRWQWADEHGLPVARQLGDSRITWPDGSCWATMARENTYGRSLNLVLADEAWAWTSHDFWQAVFPTMAARPDGQAVLFSAASDLPKSLPASLLSSPDTVATMLWGAPPGADPADRRVWRAASAYWDGTREQSMHVASTQASFESQWLNMWPEHATTQLHWLPLDDWNATRDPDLAVPPSPQVAVVEDQRHSAGGTVAFAWPDGDSVCVAAFLTDTMAEAWERAADAGRVLCGVTLAREPSARALAASQVGGREVPRGLQTLKQLAAERRLRWHGDALDKQLRTVQVVDMQPSRRQPSNLVRAAGWAVAEVRDESEPILI